MIAPDVTVVKANPGFWEDVIAKKFKFKSYFEVVEIWKDEIVVKSDESNDVLEAVLKISKEYPTHTFRVKTGSKDYWNYVVKLYGCKDGVSKLIFEGYEYYYSIVVNNNHDYDEKELEMFKKKLREIYRRIDNPNPEKIHLDVPLNGCKNEEVANIEGLSYIVTYTTEKTGFKATRQGLTYVCIDIWPLRPVF
jgi:hypothetical protein